MENETGFLTPEQVAKEMKVHPDFVDKAITEGGLELTEFGDIKKFAIKKGDFARWRDTIDPMALKDAQLKRLGGWKRTKTAQDEVVEELTGIEKTIGKELEKKQAEEETSSRIIMGTEEKTEQQIQNEITEEKLKKYPSISETAKKLGVDKDGVLTLVNDGKLKLVSIGGEWRVDLDASKYKK